jgi:P4 family phage/plasmid primase-like protien
VDSDGELDGFLQLNPALQGTLVTKGARGGQIWCRIDGEHPHLTKLKTDDGTDWGEWRADGGQSVIHGTHPTGVPYQRLNNAPPVTIRFAEIVWPGHIKLPWVKDAGDLLVERCGPAYKLGKKLTINDLFFAEKFRIEHPLIWEPLEREFYRYDLPSGLWKKVTSDTLKLKLGNDFKQVSDATGLQDFVFLRTDSSLGGLVSLLKGTVEEWDAFKRPANRFIHLRNGIFDLGVHPPELKTFHPDYRSRNASPFVFDPEAECPEFLNNLLGSALGEDDIELLQLWAGSVLLGQNPAQRLLIITGTPGGGKSALVEVIEKIIGEQNVAQLRTKHLGRQFEMYKFLGKTLLSGKDVPTNFLAEENASILKALVGGDLLDAEKKNGNEHFQLRGCFNVAITCNDRLTVRLNGDTGAWERRLLIIQYDRPKPKRRIAEYAAELVKKEGPGILNWLVIGAMKYVAEVKEFGDLRLTPAQRRRVEKLLQESDSLRHFVETRITKSPKYDLTCDDLRNGYLEFCEEQEWRPIDQREFNAQIAELMMRTHRVSPTSRTGEVKNS